MSYPYDKGLNNWDGLRCEADQFLNHMITYRNAMREEFPDDVHVIDERFEKLSVMLDLMVDKLGLIAYPPARRAAE